MQTFPKKANLKLTRHIGIENELYVKDYDWGGAVGYGCIPKRAKDILVKTKLLSYDTTDSGAREIVTNPINVKAFYQKNGEKAIREYYTTIKSFARVSRSNGTHLHISILNKDHPNMERNAMALSIAFFPEFQKIAGRSSHWAGRPGLANNGRIESHLMQCRGQRENRSYSRNYYILTPTGHQTLEFRGPRGSTNVEEIMAWAEFLDNIVKLANCDSVHGVQFKQLLEGERISKYAKKLRGTRYIYVKDLNKKLNQNKLI